MIFCKIDDKLIAIIKQLAGNRTIVDCGAGDGLLGHLVPGVLSLELYPDHERSLSPLIPMDVTKFPFIEQQFPVFIRPCHSGFPGFAVQNSIDTISDFLYVSDPDNTKTDLNEVLHIPGIVITDLKWTGEDGEKAYHVVVNQEKYEKTTEKKHYYLIKPESWRFPGWVLKGHRWGKDIWMGLNGGGFPIRDEEVLDEAWVYDDLELDYSKCEVMNLKQDLSEGYLDRNGRFYQAAYNWHIRVATVVIGIEAQELEKRGWVKLQSGNYYIRGRLSYEQVRWLEKHGHEVREYDKPDSGNI